MKKIILAVSVLLLITLTGCTTDDLSLNSMKNKANNAASSEVNSAKSKVNAKQDEAINKVTNKIKL